jgi:molybdopterin biosynthesis enzyme
MRDMLGRGEALSVQEALRLISENLKATTPKEDISGLADSFGKVLSRDIISPEDLPGYSTVLRSFPQTPSGPRKTILLI